MNAVAVPATSAGWQKGVKVACARAEETGAAGQLPANHQHVSGKRRVLGEDVEQKAGGRAARGRSIGGAVLRARAGGVCGAGFLDALVAARICDGRRLDVRDLARRLAMVGGGGSHGRCGLDRHQSSPAASFDKLRMRRGSTGEV
jgi:hypothetical protein